MDALIGIAGVITVAAITPGPNNLVVMRTAAQTGWRAALRAIAGIVLGGLVLLALAATGTAALFAAQPRLRIALTIMGCLYLGATGVRLMCRRSADAGGASVTPPASVTGLFVFQFLNPKSWILTVTAVSAQAAASSGVAFAKLAALFVAIPLLCLLLWSALGLAMATFMERGGAAARFDRAMGGLLVASALLLLAGA